ncbi:hypothetical protein [Candidatus Hecatella orcuttiae]|jgi:hypothetical protein|uniref:hypothetical protein n=1 Tax=Candidatus Hecatella orcuttiae TaxID=1935119 RepID=UPI00286824F2|nr:hypothetical protein [Candidatus Hecatella orcuttiae]
MSRILPTDKVKRTIARIYEEDPKGWHMLVGRDVKGYHDILVIHNSEFWHIKEQSLNPYETVGFGVHGILEDRKLPPGLSAEFPYGFRPLTRHQTAQLAEVFRTGDNLQKVVQSLFATQPTSLRQLNSPIVMQGPILHAEKPLGILSEGHRKLDSELRRQLERLLYEKYPHTITQYI